MILSFSKDDLVDKILRGDKEQAIRRDKDNLWQAGNTIHFWRGNPKGSYLFAEGVCSAVWNIKITPYDVFIYNEEVLLARLYFHRELHDFALSDGFNSWNDLISFFDLPFTGKIIYWMHEDLKFHQL